MRLNKASKLRYPSKSLNSIRDKGQESVIIPKTNFDNP